MSIFSKLFNKPSKKEFFESIKNLDIAKVKNAIESGQNVNAMIKVKEDENEKDTALMVLVEEIWNKDEKLKQKYWELIQFLIDNGANPDLMCSYPGTPLHCAVSNKDYETTKLLLDNDADVNIRNKYKSTPLHETQFHKDNKITLLLLQHGAEIDAINEKGETPLLNAVSMKSYEIAKVLVEHGANIELSDNDNRNPIELATTWDNLDFMKYLVENGSNIDKLDFLKLLKTSALFASLNSFKYFMSKITDYSEFNGWYFGGKRFRILHVAVGCIQILERIQRGYRFELASEKRLDMVKTLIDSGVATDVKDKDNLLPIDYVQLLLNNLENWETLPSFNDSETIETTKYYYTQIKDLLQKA